MRQPGLVQIALKKSPQHVLPAALIYDYPLDPNAYLNLAQYSVCPTFLNALNGPASLEHCACFQGDLSDASTIVTCVCPGGFWGFRHYLGMPLSISPTADAPSGLTYRKTRICGRRIHRSRLTLHEKPMKWR